MRARFHRLRAAADGGWDRTSERETRGGPLSACRLALAVCQTAKHTVYFQNKKTTQNNTSKRTKVKIQHTHKERTRHPKIRSGLTADSSRRAPVSLCSRANSSNHPVWVNVSFRSHSLPILFTSLSETRYLATQETPMSLRRQPLSAMRFKWCTVKGCTA